MLVNSNLSCSDYLTMVRVASSHYLTIMAATAQFACPRHDASGGFQISHHTIANIAQRHGGAAEAA
jgi:hypothetical protein